MCTKKTYFLYKGKSERPAFLPYEEAKKVVNALGLKSQDDWKRWSRTERPPDIPSAPWVTYKDSGWNGYADWFGKDKDKESEYMKNENIDLEIDISSGSKNFTVYTMDLTKKYIDINADYRS